MARTVLRLIIVASVLVALTSGNAGAQAWVKKRGEYFFKFTGQYLYTTEEFNSNGDLQEINAEDEGKSDASFREVAFTAYIEYGLTDQFTLVANVPFKVLTTEEIEQLAAGTRSIETTRTNGGLGDLDLYLRLPIVQRSFAMSFQPGLKIPLGYEQNPDNNGPALGSGEIDGEINLIAGLSLYPLPAYLSAAAGYRVRGGELHDEILFGAEGGVTFGRLFVKLRFEGTKNETTPPDLFGETVVTPVAGGGGGINDVLIGDQDVYKILPTISYSFGETFEATAEAYHTFAGKNTLAGTTYAVGIVLKR